MKHLGVIGGLGPMATAYFLELVVKMTDAKTDQDHLPVTVLNRPAIPDRTAYILGKSDESPLPAIIRYAKELQTFGASCIAIPCITSHHFYDEFSNAVDIPIINIVAETAAYLNSHGIQKAGIMATSGTISTNLFQDALAKEGIAFATKGHAPHLRQRQGRPSGRNGAFPGSVRGTAGYGLPVYHFGLH